MKKVQILASILIISLMMIPQFVSAQTGTDSCTGFTAIDEEHVIARHVIYGIPFDLIAASSDMEIAVVLSFIHRDSAGNVQKMPLEILTRLPRPRLGETTTIMVPSLAYDKSLPVSFKNCDDIVHVRPSPELITPSPQPLVIPDLPSDTEVCSNPASIDYQGDTLLHLTSFFGRSITLLLTLGTQPNQSGELPLSSVVLALGLDETVTPIGTSSRSYVPQDNSVNFLPVSFDGQTVQFIAFANCNGQVSYLPLLDNATPTNDSPVTEPTPGSILDEFDSP